MIAGGACYTSAGGQKGLKALGAGPSAGASDCAHKAGMGLTAKVSGGEAVRLTAELDPKAKRERPTLKKGAAHEKALGQGSGAVLQE